MTKRTNEQTGRVFTIDDLPEIPVQAIPAIDDQAAQSAALREKLSDALTPGFQAEFDPEEAENAGAFQEDALNEMDAAASADDLAFSEGPALADDAVAMDIPPFITTANARELFDLRPGETVSGALARREAARKA